MSVWRLTVHWLDSHIYRTSPKVHVKEVYITLHHLPTPSEMHAKVGAVKAPHDKCVRTSSVCSVYSPTHMSWQTSGTLFLSQQGTWFFPSAIQLTIFAKNGSHLVGWIPGKWIKDSKISFFAKLSNSFVYHLNQNTTSDFPQTVHIWVWGFKYIHALNVKLYFPNILLYIQILI